MSAKVHLRLVGWTDPNFELDHAVIELHCLCQESGTEANTHTHTERIEMSNAQGNTSSDGMLMRKSPLVECSVIA